MSKKIEVGMMVRIVRAMNQTHLIGHVGRVTGLKRIHETGAPLWYVEGAEAYDVPPCGVAAAWDEALLEPINPDNDPSTWEEVQKLTNWNPTKVVA